MLLPKKGNSNLAEQKRLLKSVLRLLKGYQVVVIGDREFGNINLADWLSKQQCQYVLRTKSNKYIQFSTGVIQQLVSLKLKPGKSFYLKQVKFTKQPGMTRVNLDGYWSKTTLDKSKNEGWYLINNLANLEQTIKAYKKRRGIEAMFKSSVWRIQFATLRNVDCKSGDYNLEKCQGNDKRLLSLILLIALAYTCAVKQGKIITFKGVKEYICSLKEHLRKDKRHSDFGIGLYGDL